ncbi:MAG: HGGxSTG domain-containing protein [Pseudomonadales bacterium]
MTSSIDLRKLWRQYHRACEARYQEWAERNYCHPYPEPLPFPDALHGLMCGAKTRAGTPCKRRDLYLSGRCRLHGGLSTGPKGKAPTP